jgi:hypothetical protein
MVTTLHTKQNQKFKEEFHTILAQVLGILLFVSPKPLKKSPSGV